MNIFFLLITIIGLSLFEIVSSIDNAVINAEVLATMSKKAQRWFLLHGILFAVFIVRGLLPWLLVWIMNPALGFLGSFTATFSNDPAIHASFEKSTPLLMLAGGVFLLFLFLNWLFIEDKSYGLQSEKFFTQNGPWFYGFAAVFITVIIFFTIQSNHEKTIAVLIGAVAFFITNGFKKNAEANEAKLLNGDTKRSDMSKMIYLEIIDTTFSIDGVLGAFAFTMSVPLMIIGTGLGAIVVRQLTLGNIHAIKKYMFLKNGAMYSVFSLGVIMILEGFSVHIPTFISPLVTVLIIGFFFIKSIFQARKVKA